ncbi:putative DMT superfamily transporter inner membrane protein [Clostridium puniceum]|uniref:Putative DMT superfamily transporter inner membrane protein n=1 Tax=Clostridium puniceum TaxID=29367 RepID=A0A1S8T9J8_9CLOT|nr:DMT family transporter [Clostridium puniceum]OOM74352.1 putative DMT superfamily transporter inner membrane protein [Clostridium puniceum]
MKINSKKAELLMGSVSLAWGSSYLLMKIGLDSASLFNLIALRFGIAFIFMALIFLRRFRVLTVLIFAKGVLMGVLLFMLFSGLVYGVNHTTASTAGFLASTTVIIVPILESILKRRLPNKSIMLSILLAVIGLYLLTVKDTFALDRDSVYCLLTALFYAIYIVVLDRIAKNGDTLIISIIQLGVTSLLGVLFMLLVEATSLPETPIQWGAIICLGLICSAYVFVIQPIVQRYVSSEKIGLIFSIEPVFSAVLSYIFLHEVLNLKGYIGAALIFSSVVFSKITKTKVIP